MIFILRYWKLLSVGLVIAVLLGTTGYYKIDRDRWKKIAAVLRIDLDQARVLTATEIAKHEATKKAYRDAQAEAERLEAERLARITAEQERINNARLASYSNRLAAARAVADRLRKQALGGTSVVGEAGCQQVPDTEHSAGASGAACGDGFSIDRRLIATKQAVQLDELITAVKENQAVK